VVDMGVTVGVVELEVIGLVVGVVDGDYLMMVEVVEEDCSMDDPTRFGAYYHLDFDHQV